MISRHSFTRALLMTLVLTSSSLALSQSTPPEKWPTRPIKMIIPFSAGGPLDSLARKFGQKLTDILGTPVIVENRAGANGIIGADLVAKSAPDGYTMLFMTGSFTGNSALYKKLPFDPIKDFAPVTQLGRSYGLVLVLNDAVPAKSLKELIALAKSKPGQLNYSSGGEGNLTHLAGELLNHSANIQITHVPYKGSGPALTDVLAGQVDMTFVSTVGSLQVMKEKRILPIAITSSIRSPALPDVATFSEFGFNEMEKIFGWYGLWYPAGTPADRVDRVQQAIQQILKMPDIKAHFNEVGLMPVGSSPKDFAQFIREDIAYQDSLFKIAKVAKQ